MKKIKNIFKEENFKFLEYSCTKENKETERLKLKVLNPNEVLIDLNTGGKDTPLYIEALLKLPQKETGEIYFTIESIGKSALSSLSITTDYTNTGRDIVLYSSKQLIILNLNDNEYISFKFTPYCKHDQAEKIKITCI